MWRPSGLQAGCVLEASGVVKGKGAPPSGPAGAFTPRAIRLAAGGSPGTSHSRVIVRLDSIDAVVTGTTTQRPSGEGAGAPTLGMLQRSCGVRARGAADDFDPFRLRLFGLIGVLLSTTQLASALRKVILA
jgi:hypothetical protein